MSDYNLGTARGVVEIEYKGDGLKDAQKDLGQTEAQAKAAGPTLAGVGKKAGVAGLAIAGGLGLAVKAASDFESKMSAVQAVSGATAGEMDLLTQKALQLGKDTAFSAGESANAIEELVKAGLSVEDVLNGAADATVALAAAGGIDMANAASISSNAMNQFGLAAEDMVGVVDNIAGAANASAIDTNQFGMALAQVGAVANLAGANFEDTATAIALMGNAGIKGSDAGTSLKTMLNSLQPTTEKQTDLMTELGIVTEDGANRFYDAEGNLKSLADVSGILQGALSGLTKQQQQMALKTMFGSDAIRAAAVLADNGAAGFENMADAMGEVSAADVAATKMDNLAGSVEQMKGSLETAGIALGTILIPAVRSVADGVTGLLNKFLSLDEGTQKTLVQILGVSAGLLVGLAVFAKLVKMLQAIKVAFVAIRVPAMLAWIAALGPIGLVIAAIAGVVAVVMLLWNRSEKFREVVTNVWEAIKSAVGAVGEWFAGPFADFFKNAWASIQGAFQGIAEWFSSVWESVKAVTSGVWNGITGVVRSGLNIISSIIRAVVGSIRGVWEAFWGIFGGVVKAAWGLIKAIVKLGWTIVRGLFLLYARALRAVWTNLWNAVRKVVSAAWNGIKGVVLAGVNFVRRIVTAVWNAIRAVTSRVWNAVASVIRVVWGRIRGSVMGAVNAVKSVISRAWEAVRSTTSRMWNALKGIITGAIDNFMGAVRGIKDRVLGALSGAGGWLLSKGREIIQGLIDGITSMISNVTGAIGRVTGAIARMLPGSPVKEGPLVVLNKGYAGKQIVDMVISGVAKMEAPLQETFAAVTTLPPLEADLSTVGAASLVTVPSGGFEAGRTASPASRIVEGTLSIDRNGRAFFRGVAEDVYQQEAQYQARRGRQR